MKTIDFVAYNENKGANKKIIKQLETDLISSFGTLYNIHLMMNPWDVYYADNLVEEDLIKEKIKWHMSCDVHSKKVFDENASKDGKNHINSNYGYLVFSDENFNQFEHCYNKLFWNQNAKDAQIIYNRPSMQIDWCERGKNDFVKFNCSHFFIENGKLDMIHSQSNCDFYKDFAVDFAWIATIYQLMYNHLVNTKYKDLKKGDIHYNIDCLYK